MAIAKENKVVHGSDLTLVADWAESKFVLKETGKGLSSNDFSAAYKAMLDTIDSSPTSGSGNLVTSGGVKTALGDYLPLTGGTVTGNISSTGFSFPRNANSASINANGWYTVYTGASSNAYGNSVILNINRTFVSTTNESYTVAVNGIYSGNIKFTQLCAAVNSQLITKVRVVYVNSGSYIIQIYYSSTSSNLVSVTGVGNGTFSAPARDDSPTGTSVEFRLTTSGVVADGGITTTLQTSQPSGGMLPNRQYALGELSGDTTFAMAAGASGETNHYYWTFSTPSTTPTITWPAAITSWFGGSAPTISASKHYEVSVLDGVAICMEV